MWAKFRASVSVATCKNLRESNTNNIQTHSPSDSSFKSVAESHEPPGAVCEVPLPKQFALLASQCENYAIKQLSRAPPGATLHQRRQAHERRLVRPMRLVVGKSRRQALNTSTGPLMLKTNGKLRLRDHCCRSLAIDRALHLHSLASELLTTTSSTSAS